MLSETQAHNLTIYYAVINKDKQPNLKMEAMISHVGSDHKLVSRKIVVKISTAKDCC